MRAYGARHGLTYDARAAVREVPRQGTRPGRMYTPFYDKKRKKGIGPPDLACQDQRPRTAPWQPGQHSIPSVNSLRNRSARPAATHGAACPCVMPESAACLRSDQNRGIAPCGLACPGSVLLAHTHLPTNSHGPSNSYQGTDVGNSGIRRRAGCNAPFGGKAIAPPPWHSCECLQSDRGCQGTCVACARGPPAA